MRSAAINRSDKADKPTSEIFDIFFNQYFFSIFLALNPLKKCIKVSSENFFYWESCWTARMYKISAVKISKKFYSQIHCKTNLKKFRLKSIVKYIPTSFTVIFIVKKFENCVDSPSEWEKLQLWVLVAIFSEEKPQYCYRRNL